MDIPGILNVSIMLIITLFAFVIIMYGVKKLKNFTPKRLNDLEILGGASVGQRGKIVLVRSDKIRLLLGVTESSINTLHVFKDIETPVEESGQFERTLTELKGKKSEKI